MTEETGILRREGPLPAAPDPGPRSTDEGSGSGGAPKKDADWLGELKSIGLLVLAVLAFHSFIAKPFYIPSESMMPTLLVGDRLVVSKYPYGWSWVSPSFHIMPESRGKLFGRVPARGDVVIAVPPGASADYIKRVVGLPGDRLALVRGQVYLNGRPVKREARPPALIPIDENVPCAPEDFPDARVQGSDGKAYCRLPIFRETLPDGRSYDTADLGYSIADDFGPITVPPGHVFLMGDNRDRSADSRFSLEEKGLGGPVPLSNIGGRAELITFSLDGSAQLLNPFSWPGSLRGGRAGTSLLPDRAQD